MPSRWRSVLQTRRCYKRVFAFSIDGESLWQYTASLFFLLIVWHSVWSLLVSWFRVVSDIAWKLQSWLAPQELLFLCSNGAYWMKFWAIESFCRFLIGCLDIACAFAGSDIWEARWRSSAKFISYDNELTFAFWHHLEGRRFELHCSLRSYQYCFLDFWWFSFIFFAKFPNLTFRTHLVVASQVA